MIWLWDLNLGSTCTHPLLSELRKFFNILFLAIHDLILGFEFEFYPHLTPQDLRKFFKKIVFNN